MVTGRNMIIVLIIAAVIGTVVILRKPSDEQLIRNQLTQLAELATRQTGEQPMEALTKAGKISSLFTQTSILKVDNPPSEESLSRQQVKQRIIMARNFFSSLNVTFYDVNVIISSPIQADVVLTMRLSGQMHGENYTDTQEVDFVFKKTEKNWLISSVKLVEFLEK